MKVNCAYKFELILKPEQRAKCAQFVGNCRYVYNKAVEIQLRQLETKQPFVSYKELASQLVGNQLQEPNRKQPTFQVTSSFLFFLTVLC